MASNLGQYLPNFYEGVRETNELMRVENGLFDELGRQMRAVIDNQFILTCDLATLAFWERILNILHDPDTESTQFRRERIINRFSSRPPFTMHWLEKRLATLTDNNFQTIEDFDNNRLEIITRIENGAVLQELNLMIMTVAPANMIITVNNQLNVMAKGDLFIGATKQSVATHLITNDFSEEYAGQQVYLSKQKRKTIAHGTVVQLITRSEE